MTPAELANLNSGLVDDSKAIASNIATSNNWMSPLPTLSLATEKAIARKVSLQKICVAFADAYATGGFSGGIAAVDALGY